MSEPREDEDQPESPLLGEYVQEDPAETLEGDDLNADPLDAGYIPPDRPSAATRDGDIDGVGRSLDDRLAEEEPDLDSTGERGREDLGAEDPRAGRLTEDAHRTGDDFGVDVGIDGGAASAEEAAVHERRDG